MWFLDTHISTVRLMADHGVYIGSSEIRAVIAFLVLQARRPKFRDDTRLRDLSTGPPRETKEQTLNPVQNLNPSLCHSMNKSKKSGNIFYAFHSQPFWGSITECL